MNQRSGASFHEGTFLQSAATLTAGTAAVSFPHLHADFTNTGGSYPAISGAVVSASGFLSPTAGSFVELAEQGTITIKNSSGQQVGSPARSSPEPDRWRSCAQFPGDFSLTGTDLFGLTNITSGVGFSVDASLTLVSDPGSLIQLSSLSDVSGPLPNIGASPARCSGALVVCRAWHGPADAGRRVGLAKRSDQDPTAPVSDSTTWAACIPFVSGLFVCLFLLATIPAPVPAGTITVDDIDQPISISSTLLQHHLDLLQLAASAGDVSGKLLQSGRSPAAGAGPVGDLRRGLPGTVPKRVGPDRQRVHRGHAYRPEQSHAHAEPLGQRVFRGHRDRADYSGPRVYFLTAPGGFFDVAAYLQRSASTRCSHRLTRGDRRRLGSRALVADPVRCCRADHSGCRPTSPKPRSIRGQTALGSITIAQEVIRPEP